MDSVNGQTGVVVLDAADVGAAATAHTHAASDVASGTLAIARIPTGTSGTTVPLGNDARFTDQRVPTDSSVTDAKVASGAAIALSKLATDPLARANHTGTQSADTIVDGTTNHVFTTGDDTKLAGIATGATANSTDAQLRDRATHTGTQAISTVSGLQTALDGAQPLDSDLTTFADLSPSNDDFVQRKAGAWANRTVAQVRADLLLVPAPPSGKYFFPASQAEGGTPGFGANGTSRFMPWLVERSITVDRIGIEVTTIGDVGSLLRLGIYSDTGAGRPGALLLDAGTVVGDALGNKELTISQALAPGIYWIGCAVQAVTTTSPTLRMISDYHPPILITLDAAPSAGAGIAGYTESGVTGALSANFSATPTASGTMPRLFFRTA